MATKRARFTISLNPHMYATLKRLSELGGQPLSTIVSEILESVHEPFMRTVALMEAAASAPREVKDGLRQTVENVERELYGTIGYSTAQIDWLTEQFGKKGGGEKAGACAAASPPPASPNPHVVTRGSGSPKTSHTAPPKTAFKPIKTRVSKGGKHRG